MELRSTSGGAAVLSFGVTVNDRRRNPQTGEWKDYPNFIDCAMFGPRAETLSRYPAKGTKVTIEGRLRWSQWEAEDRKRSKIEVVVEGVEFLVHWERGGGDEADRTAMPSTDDEQPTLYDEDARF